MILISMKFIYLCLVLVLINVAIAIDADDCVIGVGTAGSNLAKR